MIEISLNLDANHLDLAEELCWLHGALSVSNSPLDQNPVTLKALLQEDCPSLRQDLISNFPSSKIHSQTIGELDWIEQVRAGFRPLRVGQVSIVAEWDTIPHGEVIRVLPGQAFGTGQHETTQLALQFMQEIDLKGKKVLDVGCGTGILAIAAEKFGAASTLGIDNDPDCQANMLAHLELNQTENITLKIDTLEHVTEAGFDVVIANITLNVLRLVWPLIWEKMGSDSKLITTGILTVQKDEAFQILSSLGFEIVEHTTQGEWVAILARKR